MPTRLYLHTTANFLSGTFPTTEQSTATATWSNPGATSIKMMDTVVGLTQTSVGGTSTAVTTQQKGFIQMFVSPPLVSDQTVGGGSWTFCCADKQSNTAMVGWANMLNLYVWRPSTGARVGTMSDTGTSSGGTVATATTEQVTIYSRGTSAVGASSGDVIICEVWCSHVQTMATAYRQTLYFDGDVVNNTENAVVNAQASYLEMSEDVRFSPGDAFLGAGFFGH